jgi:hypothetical protein
MEGTTVSVLVLSLTALLYSLYVQIENYTTPNADPVPVAHVIDEEYIKIK